MYIYIFAVMGEGRIYDMFYTVNDLINAHFQINASFLINAPSTVLKLYSTPLSNKHPLSNRRPHKNDSKILGIHSIHSVSGLINKALRILSCLISSSK